jgi:leader peptidase (prepilin peptidase)/N-methyltransferase
MNFSDWFLRSKRYSATLFAEIFRYYPDLWPLYLALAFILCAVITYELRHQIIPHTVTAPGIVAGLGFAAYFQHVVPLSAVAACLGGLAACLLTNWVRERKGQEPGIGGGAAMLVSMVGAFVGVIGLLVSVNLAALSALVTFKALRRSTLVVSIELGPHLALGTVAYLLLFF